MQQQDWTLGWSCLGQRRTSEGCRRGGAVAPDQHQYEIGGIEVTLDQFSRAFAKRARVTIRLYKLHLGKQGCGELQHERTPINGRNCSNDSLCPV